MSSVSQRPCVTLAWSVMKRYMIESFLVREGWRLCLCCLLCTSVAVTLQMGLEETHSFIACWRPYDICVVLACDVMMGDTLVDDCDTSKQHRELVWLMTCGLYIWKKYVYIHAAYVYSSIYTLAQYIHIFEKIYVRCLSLCHACLFVVCSHIGSYLVDPASSHMLVSKIKPCMSKYKLLYTVKLRMAH